MPDFNNLQDAKSFAESKINQELIWEVVTVQAKIELLGLRFTLPIIKNGDKYQASTSFISETITLQTLSNILIRKGYEDMFDFSITEDVLERDEKGDYTGFGSFADKQGENVIYFKLLEEPFHEDWLNVDVTVLI